MAKALHSSTSNPTSMDKKCDCGCNKTLPKGKRRFFNNRHKDRYHNIVNPRGKFAHLAGVGLPMSMKAPPGYRGKAPRLNYVHITRLSDMMRSKYDTGEPGWITKNGFIGLSDSDYDHLIGSEAMEEGWDGHKNAH